MARLRALSDLRSDVAARAGVTLSASGRHTTGQATRDINQSCQAWRNKVQAAAPTYYVERDSYTTSTSASISTEGWEAREYLELGSTLQEVVAVSVVDDGVLVPLMPMAWSERGDLESEPYNGGTVTGRPAFWRLAGTKNATTHTHYLILAPKADAAYTVYVDVVPIFADLSADGDVFDGILGGDEWVVCDVVRKMYLRNGLAGTPEYGALLREMQEWERSMAFALARQHGPGRKRDTRRERMALRRYSAAPWRGS